MDELNTHGLILAFGKHKGELWTRVPISYISWLANKKEDSEVVRIARAEQKRRGTTYPTIEISGHAIDRASFHCLYFWRRSANRDEGLNSWLIRKSNEAREKGELRDGKYVYEDMKFVFEEGEFYPTLKTIMKI